MDYLNLNPQNGNRKPKSGVLLIAEPLLKDPDFSRSVVLLCEHGEDGSLGFVLNQATAFTLHDLMKQVPAPGPDIYQGGPVQPETLHMLHRMPGELGGIEVAPGIYWGGSYEKLQDLIAANDYNLADLRLFIGYSGWGAGQLDNEMKEGTWLLADVNVDLLFDSAPENIWKNAIALLGKNMLSLLICLRIRN